VVFGVGQADVKAVLYGWKGRGKAGSQLDANTRSALDAFTRFPAPLLERARKIRTGLTLTITLLGGTEVRFGVLRQLESKAQVAQAILERERGKRLAYVDVRSPTVPVSRERSAPTPSPGASPAQGPTAASTPGPTPIQTAGASLTP
jgi:hypothetical protein